MSLRREFATFAKTITAGDIKSFIEITGDDNPIHTNPSDPSVSDIKEKLGIQLACAHGPLITSLICKPILEVGGSGTVLLETGPYKYLNPAEIGDSVLVRVRLLEPKGRNKYKLSIEMKNQYDEKIIEDTYAIIMVLD